MASRAARHPPLAAYVLHRYDWSESSLILDVFTREQGRIAVAAKGAKRPFSQLRSVLLPFQRLHVSLGRDAAGDESREVQTLRAADWAGGHAMLTGPALFSGFYVNELLMKLLARHDPHPKLFDAYGETVAASSRRGATSSSRNPASSSPKAAATRPRAGRRSLRSRPRSPAATCARCSAPPPTRSPSSGRCCARSFTIISALRSCARAR